MIGQTTPDTDDRNDEKAPLPAPGVGSVRPKEIGGREGLEPTRYGDWEKNGRCIDF